MIDELLREFISHVKIDEKEQELFRQVSEFIEQNKNKFAHEILEEMKVRGIIDSYEFDEEGFLIFKRGGVSVRTMYCIYICEDEGV